MKTLTNFYLTLILSLFFLNLSAYSIKDHTPEAVRTMQRIRIDFESTNGYVRPLLLAFTPDNSATDGVDYGYDGHNFDQFPDDLFWMIDNDSYVIQGVGEFDISKQYPLGMFLSNSGTIKISLNSLENFDNSIEVYVFDSLLDTYSLINEIFFNAEMSSGDYVNRFFIAFMNPNSSEDDDSAILNTDEFNNIDHTIISYISNSNQLIIKSNTILTHLEIYNITGQKLYSLKNINSKTLNIPINFNTSKYGIVKVYNRNNYQSKMILLN